MKADIMLALSLKMDQPLRQEPSCHTWFLKLSPLHQDSREDWLTSEPFVRQLVCHTVPRTLLNSSGSGCSLDNQWMLMNLRGKDQGRKVLLLRSPPSIPTLGLHTHRILNNVIMIMPRIYNHNQDSQKAMHHLLVEYDICMTCQLSGSYFSHVELRNCFAMLIFIPLASRLGVFDETGPCPINGNTREKNLLCHACLHPQLVSISRLSCVFLQAFCPFFFPFHKLQTSLVSADRYTHIAHAS